MQRLEKLRALFSECDGVYIKDRANIFYYSGFTSEDGALLITKDRAVLITDSRYLIQAKQEASGFEIFNVADGTDKLFEGIKRLGFEENSLTVAQFNLLGKKADKAELVELGDKISRPRAVKEPGEIEKIKNAEALGDEAFLHILKIIKTGMREVDVAFELESFMRKNGASGVSFDTIVASGVRSAMPHGTASEKIIEQGDFVTLDFGCVLDGYCSDMTRTVVMGRADQRQREIYDIVLKAQTAGLEAAVAGIACAEVDKAARKIIEDAGYGKNFGHSLGHSVGIEIHENPNFSPKSTALCETGNVITVEPGIYIDGFGGVRIEDVVAITTKNAQNLTKSEKDLIII